MWAIVVLEKNREREEVRLELSHSGFLPAWVSMLSWRSGVSFLCLSVPVYVFEQACLTWQEVTRASKLAPIAPVSPPDNARVGHQRTGKAFRRIAVSTSVQCSSG